jgi:hypothetical protein
MLLPERDDMDFCVVDMTNLKHCIIASGILEVILMTKIITHTLSASRLEFVHVTEARNDIYHDSTMDRTF